jgi:hypothetical protein
MDVKETLKGIGKGMVIRRAASMIAHGKDHKKYVDGIKDFSPAERTDIKERAEVLGENLRKGGKRG